MKTRKPVMLMYVSVFFLQLILPARASRAYGLTLAMVASGSVLGRRLWDDDAQDRVALLSDIHINSAWRV